jgi:hypothetical protein
MGDPVTGGAQLSLDNTPSAICTLGVRPIMMTGAILWLIRRHFSSADYIVDENLRKYVWHNSAEESTISIESVTRFSGPPSQALEKRPAIYVKRNTWSSQTVGLGHKFQNAPQAVLRGKPVGGSLEVFGLGLAGSHTVFCIGGREAEAEALGTEVFYELLEFSPLIKRDLGLYKLDVAQMAEAQRLEESDEHWAVPIVVSYVVQHNWKLTPEELALKTVQLTVDG